VLPHLSHVAYIFHISEKFALFLSVHFDSLTRHPREGCASEAGGWGTFTALRIPAAGFANTRATERRARNAHQQPRNSQVKNA